MCSQCGAVPAAGLTYSEAEAQLLRLPCVVVGLASSGQNNTPAVGVWLTMPASLGVVAVLDFEAL